MVHVQEKPSRSLTLAVLLAFLSLFAQPQVATLYHTHPGGTHAHIHAHLLLSPTAEGNHNSPESHSHSHHSHHSHSHPHQHVHTEGVVHVHQQAAHSSPAHTLPAYRHARTPRNGHWHTSIALHLTTLLTAAAIFPGFRIQPLLVEERSSPFVAPQQLFQPRAPPSLL